LRPADHVVDRRGAHRAGDLDAGCGTRKSDVRSIMTPSRTMRRPSELVEAGLVPQERFAEVERVAERYAVAITPAMAALIDAADPNHPIARQSLPDPGELDVLPDETADPIGDDVHSPVDGLVHRYPDRVLLKLVNVCAVYCRFCFRRETIGPGKPNAL